MIWFFIWLLFAVSVLTFMGWSTNIIMAQRKAWTEFATKYKLTIEKETDGLVPPISITGTMHGRTLNVYNVRESNESQRLQNNFVHIEVFLKEIPPTPFILSKRRLPPIISDIAFAQDFDMQTPEWPKPAVASTDDPIKLANWLLGTRMRAFKNFMEAAGRGDEPILMNDGRIAFLLWRTNDPLRDPRQLNAIVQKLYGWAKEFDMPQ